ncbi:MAG: peptidylprolyl isomerase [Gemmatimonadales bacterium]
MKHSRRVSSVLVLAGVCAACSGDSGAARSDETGRPATELIPTVVLETNMGRIVIRLDREKAPVSVANFVSHVKSGFYNDLIFHRVIPGFVIQAGRYKADFVKRSSSGKPIQNESYNGLLNRRGTVAMARTNDPQSALDEFYINVADNPNLDPTDDSFGYAVFGEVTEGMDVVDAISKVPTTRHNRDANVPRDPVIIQRAVVQPPK